MWIQAYKYIKVLCIMNIQLLDYESGHTPYYGSIEDAEAYFCNNDQYWKLIVNWSVRMTREDCEV